jgi:hypothetical protein
VWREGDGPALAGEPFHRGQSPGRASIANYQAKQQLKLYDG